MSERRNERRRSNSKIVNLNKRADDERRQNERREKTRVPFEIWIEETADDALYFQRSANISAGGVFLDQTIPHPIGTVVNVKFQLPGVNEEIEVKAEIVNIPGNNQLGMGMKFLDLTEKYELLINNFIDSIL